MSYNKIWNYAFKMIRIFFKIKRPGLVASGLTFKKYLSFFISTLVQSILFKTWKFEKFEKNISWFEF